ncbi:MAG: hypothetical protein ACPGJU_07490 [Coraliomargarita sp.]
MKLFPPSPEHKKEALAYVKRIKGKKGTTEYQAVRLASVGSFQMAWVLMIFLPFLVKSEHVWFYTPVMALAVWSYVNGIRTERLLDLFEPTELNQSEPATGRCR